MKLKLSQVLLRTIILTIGMFILVVNMFSSQKENVVVQIFTILTFAFAIAFSITTLIAKIEQLNEEIENLKNKQQ